MKKLLILSLGLMLTITVLAQPQNRKEVKEKIEAQRVAFITEEIDLSAAEAEKFWPVYNEFHTKLKANKRKYNKQIKSVENKESLSEKDSEAIVDAQHMLKQDEAKIFAEYHQKMKAVLPASKLYKLRTAEKKFKRELLKKIRERRN